MIRKILSQQIGLIIGLIISSLLLLYQYLPFLEKPNRHNILPHKAQLIAIILVLGAGMISGFIVQHCFIKRYTKIAQIWGGIAGSILISPISLFWGIVFSPMGARFGMVGIFACTIVIIILMECIGTVIGSILGSYLSKS